MRYGVLLAIGIVLLAPLAPMKVCCFACRLHGLARPLVGLRKKPANPNRSASPECPAAARGHRRRPRGWPTIDYHAFGKATTLPYTVNRATYAIAPYYVWQSARPEPVYHDESMRYFYKENEFKAFNKIHSLTGFLPQTLAKVIRPLNSLPESPCFRPCS